jgi:hypothetical protein
MLTVPFLDRPPNPAAEQIAALGWRIGVMTYVDLNSAIPIVDIFP